MRKETLGRSILTVLVLAALAVGCSDDSPTNIGDNGNDTPGNLPVIPEPASVNDLMPARTADLVIGMSRELDTFEPVVSELLMRMDDGSEQWVTKNLRQTLACPDLLPRNTAEEAAVDASYISARPYLLHTRHWRRLEQNSLGPGTSFTLTQAVTYGTSTTHTESVEFSETMGISVSAGLAWGPFSLGVSASYEQTTTETEINSVTFSEESTETREYTVEAPDAGTRVFVLWQLVDEFSFVDADTVRIHDSPTLTRVNMPAVANILFPNESVVRMVTTDFD
jgi:hypothetical protein